MFIPLGTDAPLYHRPWATIALIAACVVTWIVVASAASDALTDSLCLEYGHGLKPWQWLTSLFMHAGIIHLIGNMIFLWVFGLVVEGKIGWLRFLLVYLGIGVSQSAIEQVMMLGSEGASLGASTAISGIMVMAALWAPRNEVDCVWIWSIMVKPFTIAIGWVVAFYVALDIWEVATSGHFMSTGLLHVMGAAIGLGVGLWMLRTNRVDCEGWDILSLWRNHGQPAKPGVPPPHPLPTPEQVDPATTAEAEVAVRSLLNQGRHQEAIAAISRIERRLGPWSLSLDLLLPLAAAQQKAGDSDKQAHLLADFLARCSPEHPQRDRVALQLVEVQLLRKRPAAALEALHGITERHLTEADRKRLQACRGQASAAVAAGTPEFQ